MKKNFMKHDLTHNKELERAFRKKDRDEREVAIRMALLTRRSV